MHSLIEFSHRFLVFVVSVLVVATAVVAWRQYRNVPSLVWPAAAAIPLVFGQAVLGGIVVHTDLNPWWVTAHFAVALAFVADVIYVAADSFCVVKLPEQGGDATGGDAAFARLTLITTGATGALLLVGTYVRARSAGLAFTDWPLMNGRLVPALGGAATAMFVASGPRGGRVPAGALGRDPRAHDGAPLEGSGACCRPSRSACSSARSSPAR